MSIGHIFAYAWAAAAAVMLVAWLAQIKHTRSAIVDIVWAFSTGALALWFIYSTPSVEPVRDCMLALMISFWSLRLTWHLSTRLYRDKDDGRYVYFREVMGKHAGWGMFLFFQVQALWALMFAAPVWAAAHTQRIGLTWVDALACAIWLSAIVGESLADHQLSRFRADPANKGRVCMDGLWRYSRHPNYFFEWLHWTAYLLIAVGSPYWWVSLVGVVVMYVFVTRITGIPYTEKQSLRSRGDAYRSYQRTTNAFFPFPPKKHTQESLS